MAKWKNESKSAVVVMHHLVLPGETVEVPEKMLKVLEPNPPAPFPSLEGEEVPSAEGQPVEGVEKPHGKGKMK